MKFEIFTVDTNKPEEVIKKYPCLYQFAFNDGYIVISGLEELVRLGRILNQELIINTTVNHEPYIEIYDGYRE